MNLVVDGSNLLHRCFWTNANSKDPLILGEVFIFLRSLKSYIKKFEADKCFVCWDKKLLFPSTNFRKEMIDVDYKGNRDRTVNIYENEDLISEFLKSIGIKNMFPRIMEADDVMAWLSIKLDGPNMIISNDADLLQMVSERTSYYNPFKKKIITIDNFEVLVGVEKKNYLIYKCILGDPSDNIIGWKGFGPVKAKKVSKDICDDPVKLREYTEEQINLLDRNKTLINLETGWCDAGPEESRAYEDQLSVEPSVDIDQFTELCKKYNFNDFLKDVVSWGKLLVRDLLTF